MAQVLTLIQSSRPIAFASKTLTNVETHCANIKRECLSLCFGLKKFHTYLYSRHIIIQNDHKLLEIIQCKPIYAHTTSPAAHVTLHAKVQLHHPVQAWQGDDTCQQPSHFHSCKESLPIAIHQNILHVQLSNDKLDAILGAVEHDPVYNTLNCLTLRGWPNHLKQVLRQVLGPQD